MEEQHQAESAEGIQTASAAAAAGMPSADSA